MSDQHVIWKTEDLRPILPKRTIREIGGSRVVSSLGDFAGQNISYRVEIPNGEVLKPKDSFFRTRLQVEVLTTDGAADDWRPQVAEYIRVTNPSAEAAGLLQEFEYDENEAGDKASALSLAYNCVSNFFKSIQFRLGGQKISDVRDLQLCDTLMKRFTPKYQKRTLDQYLVGDRQERMGLISADARSRDYLLKSGTDYITPYVHDIQYSPKGYVEVCWSPSISVFDQDVILPGLLEIEIITNSASDITNSVVESMYLSQVQCDFRVSMTDFKFFACMEQAVSELKDLRNVTYYLDMDEVQVQFQPVNQAALSTYTFDPPKSTSMVAVAFQQGKARAMNEVGYRTTSFKTLSHEPQNGNDPFHLDDPTISDKIDRLYISDESGNTYPQNQFALDHDGYNINLKSLYRNNLITLGNYRSNTGAESYEDFIELGPYYITPLASEDSQCAKRVEVNVSFNEGEDNDIVNHKPNVLLFSIYRSVTEVTYDSVGMIKSVIQKNL